MALTVTGASSYASSMTKTADIRPAHGAVRGPAALLTVMVLVTLLALLPDGARAAPPQGAGELEKQDVEAWLDGMLPALLEREAIPGASVSVVHDGEVLTERGYGFADLGTDSAGPQAVPPVPVDPHTTLFRVGSISKVPVATAAMQLVERGQLELDEPIADHLDFELETRFETPITLRHLLTHTAGFEEVIRGLFPADEQSVPTLREFLVEQAPEQIDEPGSTPAYSNYGYALVGYLIEQVSGQDLHDYLRAEVLEPAGASGATYEQPLPGSVAELAARPYPSTHEDAIGFELIGPWPAGSMSASASDMSAFMLAHLDQEDSPLLAEQSLATMHSPGLGEAELGNLAAGLQMTPGFFAEDRNGHRILGHGGDILHSHAAFQIYPEEGTGVFIGLNGSGAAADSSTVLRNAVLHGFADRYYPAAEEAPQPLETSADRAATVAGQYMVSRRGQSTFIRLNSLISTVSVEADGDTLRIPAVTDSSGQPISLVETEPWVWQDEDGAHRVAVEVGQDGEVEMIGLLPAFTLLPAPGWTTPVLLGVLAALVILGVALVAWPVRAVVGWRLSAPLLLSRRDAWLRRASLVAAALALGGIALWAVVAVSLIGAGGPSGPVMIRAAQLATLLGALGVVPAAWRAIRTWAGRRWLLAVMATLITLAFVAFTVCAVAGGLLTPDLSY